MNLLYYLLNDYSNLYSSDLYSYSETIKIYVRLGYYSFVYIYGSVVIRDFRYGLLINTLSAAVDRNIEDIREGPQNYCPDGRDTMRG